jgi:hypothetical protein
MTSRNHYELLGLPSDADSSAIKAAYKRLTRTAHPDMPTGSSGIFGLITDAYDVLRDPVRRAEYDRGLKGGTSTQSERGAPTPDPAQAKAAEQARVRAAEASSAAREAEHAAAAAALAAARYSTVRFRPREPAVICASLTVATAVRVHLGFSLPIVAGLLAMTLCGMAGLAARRSQGPLPVAERVAVLTVSALAVSGVWLTGWQGWLQLVGLAGLYFAWCGWLSWVPATPATPEQWISLSAWVGSVFRPRAAGGRGNSNKPPLNPDLLAAVVARKLSFRQAQRIQAAINSRAGR